MKHYDTVRKAQEETSNSLDVPHFRDAVNMAELNIKWPHTSHPKLLTVNPINPVYILLAFCAEIAVIIWIAKCT